MAAGRAICILYLIVFSLYALLAVQVPGVFDFGLRSVGGVLDTAFGLSGMAIFLMFVTVAVVRAVSARFVPWPLLLAFVGSMVAAWIIRVWVDQWPGLEFKAVGVYFYLATPVVAGLGLAAIWVEWRSRRMRR